MAIMADAAHTIAARYSSSDTLAHTTIHNITPALSAAVTQTLHGQWLLMRTADPDFNWDHYSVPEIAAMLDENYQVCLESGSSLADASMTIDSHRSDLAKRGMSLHTHGPSRRAAPRSSTSTLSTYSSSRWQTTAQTAFANGRARAGVLDALDDAKRSINSLNESWRTRVARVANADAHPWQPPES